MNRTRTSILGACLLPLLTLAACGGGGGGGVPVLTLESESLTLGSNPDLDGVISVSGFLAFRPSVWASFTGDVEASYGPGYEARQLYAFSLAPLPAGARVLHAELRLDQFRVEGDPYGKNGNVVVDHVDYVASPGPATYDGQDLERMIGTLSSDAALEVKSVDVTAAVRGDLEAGRTYSQYRLRFYREWHFPMLDHVNDYVRFTDGEGRTGEEPPRLVVTYQR